MAISNTLTLSAFAARRLPDEDVFARTLRGDPVAFSEVYRRYHKRIYGYCLARSLDRDAAADATQEVFMRLLRAEPGSIDNPRSWLFTVARNVSVDTIRKHARVDAVESMPDETAALGVAAADDPADVMLSKAEGRDAFLALRQLNPRYRTALILREVHGQSSRDIGEALSTTPGAVDTLVSRARDAFGAAYASVLNLDPTCRANVELIYRRLGSGITPVEEAALESHIATCERCRREARKAAEPRRLAALLPFLLPGGQLGRNLLARAATLRRSVPDAVATHAASLASQPHAMSAGAKVAAGLIAAMLVATPVVGGLTVRSAQLKRLAAPAHAIVALAAPSGTQATTAVHHAADAMAAQFSHVASSHAAGSTTHHALDPHHSTTTMSSGTHDSHSGSGSTASTPMTAPSHHSGSTSGGMTSGHTEPVHH
jgi:RNA polymerase sigma-70 factor, ECF subfamily